MFVKPAWIIFDVGGVLFDYEGARQDVASQLGIEKSQVDDMIMQSIGDKWEQTTAISVEETVTGILKSLGKLDELETVKNLWWHEPRWSRDTLRLMRECKEAGYEIAVFTNNWLGDRENSQKLISELSGYDTWFESSVEGMRKPEEKFFTLVESKLGMKGTNLFFIDDTEKNIEAAKSRGWQTFLYRLGSDQGRAANNALRSLLLM